MKNLYLLLAAVLLLLPFGCNDNNSGPDIKALQHRTADYSGDLAHSWMELGYQMIQDNQLYGPHAARIMGYLGLCTWESVYPGIPNAISMEGQINDYADAAYVDLDKEYDWGIVLCSAMRTLYPFLVDNFTAAQRSQVNVLADQQEVAMMEKGISPQTRVNSIDLGNRIGLRIAARTQRDGRDVIQNIVPVTPLRDADHKWYWAPNTPGQTPVEPLWSTIRTFAIDNAQMCEVEPPFNYSETPGSNFYQDALEVYNIERTPQNKAIAYHWENGPNRTCSPACHWVSITQQLLEGQNANLALTAKAYCMAGITAADAFSACWYMKYKYFLLRPITYIREVIDPNWTPLVNTPPYPDYTSGSATIGGAMPVVLASVFGDIPFVDRSQLGSPLFTPDGGPFVLPERSFTSITKAGEEQALSRIIGGVHFRRACEQGLVAGKCIGNSVLSRLRFEQ
ncbi:MAG: vanadium-dependent haloperoxidase [Lewinellaceae bacterium]|nr:vanadium-dependent haloperoxidase [Lewinellaceae bacterium]